MINGEIPAAELHISIPYRSLIFKRNRDLAYEAKFMALVTVYQDEDETPIFVRDYPGTLLTENYRLTRSFQDQRIKRTFPLPPGSYRAAVTIEDLHSGKSLDKSLHFSIPSKEEEFTTNLQLEGRVRNNQQWESILTYHVPNRYDSLRMRTYVSANEQQEGSKLELLVYSFPYDSLPARAPHHFNILPGSLPYIGVDFSKKDTVYARSRSLTGLFGSVGIEFELPEFTYGVYRMELMLKDSDGSIRMNMARDFSIKDSQFPLVSTLNQLAESTIYLSDPDEFRFRKLHENPDSLKRSLDSFWAGFSQSIPRARSTISAYYARVEEANLMFSTFKEGWKTDPGMIYVLFGAPSSIEKTIDGMAWYYPSQSPDYSKVFFFEAVRNPEGPLPKHNYILRRHQQYERLTQEQVLRLQQGRLD